jgi:hypothetical protein
MTSCLNETGLAPSRGSPTPRSPLAITHVFLGVPNDRQFLGFAIWRLGHLFRYRPP